MSNFVYLLVCVTILVIQSVCGQFFGNRGYFDSDYSGQGFGYSPYSYGLCYDEGVTASDSYGFYNNVGFDPYGTYNDIEYTTYGSYNDAEFAPYGSYNDFGFTAYGPYNDAAFAPYGPYNDAAFAPYGSYSDFGFAPYGPYNDFACAPYRSYYDASFAPYGLYNDFECAPYRLYNDVAFVDPYYGGQAFYVPEKPELDEDFGVVIEQTYEQEPAPGLGDYLNYDSDVVEEIDCFDTCCGLFNGDALCLALTPLLDAADSDVAFLMFSKIRTF